MDDITPLFEVDIVATITGLLVIIIAVVAIASVIVKFMELIGKPVKWVKKNDEDHEQLMATIKELRDLAEKERYVYEQTEKQAEKLSQLADGVQEMLEKTAERDKEIDALVYAEQKVLADRINQLCKHYTELGGIPEDELDEFVELHNAYHTVHGNHGVDLKFNYCTEHLPVLPVKTFITGVSDKQD